MIPGLNPTPLPEWLRAVTETSHFPVNDILNHSVFYPACGFDGRPIKHLAGFRYSFVYVDCNVQLGELNHRINTFKGYELAFRKPLKLEQICSRPYAPVLPMPEDEVRNVPQCSEMVFAEWMIYDRLPEFPETHGPERFSLLYVGGEGVETFQSLYFSNRCVPSVVVMIKCDGFSGNWTEFLNPSQIFARSVMTNPAGRPEYVLAENLDDLPTWPWYSELIATITSFSSNNNYHQKLRLWRSGE